MKISIIDYGLGNLHSVYGAIERIGGKVSITNDVSELKKSDKLILPGVGAFADGMESLKKLGLIEPLKELIIEQKKPIFAICLGFQLLAKESSEFGNHKGLGFIDAIVRKIKRNNKQIIIPHVGWNDMIKFQDSYLWNEIPKDTLFYYVHSYHVVCNNKRIIIGKCHYGIEFVSAIEYENIVATQFHPEKSQYFGLQILKNFIEKK